LKPVIIEEPRTLDWICGIAPLASAGIAAWTMTRKGPDLLIDDEGVWDLTARIEGPIYAC
jgi:hypothetical protein